MFLLTGRRRVHITVALPGRRVRTGRRKGPWFYVRMNMKDVREAKELLRSESPFELFPRLGSVDFESLVICHNGTILSLLWASLKSTHERGMLPFAFAYEWSQKVES